MTNTSRISDLRLRARGSIADYGWDTPLILDIDDDGFSALEAEIELADTLCTFLGFSPEEAARLAAGE